MTPSPFIVVNADIVLPPMSSELADMLGPAIAGIEPWSLYGYPAANMTWFLANPDSTLTCRAIYVHGKPAGAIAIRSPWLSGPYLQLLTLLPPFQCKGHGGILVDWFAEQAKPNHRCYGCRQTR